MTQQKNLPTNPSWAVKTLIWTADPCPSAQCSLGHYVINPHYCHVELLVGYYGVMTMSLGRIQLGADATEQDLRAAAQRDYQTRIERDIVEATLTRREQVIVDAVRRSCGIRTAGEVGNVWSVGVYFTGLEPAQAFHDAIAEFVRTAIEAIAAEEQPASAIVEPTSTGTSTLAFDDMVDKARAWDASAASSERAYLRGVEAAAAFHDAEAARYGAMGKRFASRRAMHEICAAQIRSLPAAATPAKREKA